MDPTRQALEAFLADNPNDLVAHAAYADWLIENDDLRGEYIRETLSLRDPDLPMEERYRLARSLARLAKAHEQEWFGSLIEFVKPEWWMLEARFGHSVDQRIGFRIHLGWIQDMFLYFPEPQIWNAVVNSPLARFVLDMRIYDHPFTSYIDDTVSEWVVHLSQFTGLRCLDVRLRYFADVGVERLLASGILSHLTDLQLNNCSITDDGALALAADPHIRKLKQLDLTWNYISPIGRETLADVGFDIGSQHPIHPNFNDNDSL